MAEAGTQKATMRHERFRYWGEVRDEAWELAREVITPKHEIGVGVLTLLFVWYFRGWGVVVGDVYTLLLFVIGPAVAYAGLVYAVSFVRAMVRVSVYRQREIQCLRDSARKDEIVWGRKIAELEGQLKSYLEKRLDVDVEISSVDAVGFAEFPALRKYGGDGLVITLKGVRFTNRSKTESVSLEVTLGVSLDCGTEGKGYLGIDENREWYDGVPPADCLFSPIEIAPQRTKAGKLHFLALPPVVRAYGGSEVFDYDHCRLEIVDHVSGKGMMKDVHQDLRRFLKSLESMDK